MSPNQITAQVENCRTQPVIDCFIRLQQTFVSLAPITTKTQYKKAMDMATALAAFGNLPRAVAQYLEVLSRNIELYERSRFSGDHNPVENLRFLLNENGLTASDLGRMLGHRELGSKILNRQRKLTVGHIRKLSNRFGVSPATFV